MSELLLAPKTVAVPAVESRTEETRRTWPTYLRRGAVVAAVAQAIVLVLYSIHMYDHFDLTLDFGVVNQAWSQIAHGHLNPYSTVNPHNYPHYGYPFWRDHLELIIWPLALLWFVYPHGIDLLVVQDLAIAGSTLVALLFVVDILERAWPSSGGTSLRGRWLSRPGAPAAIGLLALGMLVINPWIYWSASVDFHIQAVATLFTLLAARDLWSGRGRRSLWWIAGVALCGNVASTYLIGLGIFAMLTRKDLRRAGMGLVAGGIAWSVFIGAIGGAEGTLIGPNYGYLAHAAPNQAVGVPAIVMGAVTSPSTPLHMLWSRVGVIYRMLASAGLVGVLSPIGVGTAVVVLVSNELNASPVFSLPTSAFQSLPVYFFALIGTVTVLVWMARRRQLARWLLVPMALGLAAQSLAISAIWLPRAPKAFLLVDGSTSAQLGQVERRIPPGAEVVVSQGVLGRFADRRLVFPFLDISGHGQQFPVLAHTVVFVLTTEGVEYAPVSGTRTAVAFLGRLHAQADGTAGPGSNVSTFVWHPPRGTKTVVFPPTEARCESAAGPCLISAGH